MDIILTRLAALANLSSDIVVVYRWYKVYRFITYNKARVSPICIFVFFIELKLIDSRFYFFTNCVRYAHKIAYVLGVL